MEAMAMSVESPLQLCTLHNLWMHTGTRLQRQYHKTKMEKSVKQEIIGFVHNDPLDHSFGQLSVSEDISPLGSLLHFYP